MEKKLDHNIAKVLTQQEEVMAKVSGRLELGGVGGGMYGAMFPAQGFLLATNKRILYFEKVTEHEFDFEYEIAYEDVKKFTIYGDIMHGLAGLIAKILHIQDNKGNAIRLIGPSGYEAFAKYIQDKIPIQIKVKQEKNAPEAEEYKK